MEKTLLALLATLAVTVLAAAVAVPKMMSVRNDAIQGCMTTSLYRSQRIENNITITTEEPIESATQKCLQLKGLK